MRRLLKFLHTTGAIGLMGASACLLVLIGVEPAPTSVADYVSMRGAMAGIANWILFPALILTLASGLLSIAITRAFHNAGWAWVKLATGVVIFEAGLVHVVGPIQEEARHGIGAAAPLDVATIAGTYAAERGTLWLLLVISAANVALGIWRPRITSIPD